jgi:hypothetical protein
MVSIKEVLLGWRGKNVQPLVMSAEITEKVELNRSQNPQALLTEWIHRAT